MPGADQETSLPEADFDKLETIIKKDVSMAFKLLKLINSAAYGLKNEIKSIKQALTLLGINEIKKWIILILFSNIGADKPSELIKVSLTRAKFMESLAGFFNLENQGSELYLLGLFSLFDVMLDQELADILSDVPVSSQLKDTLLGAGNPFDTLYNFALNYNGIKLRRE